MATGSSIEMADVGRGLQMDDQKRLAKRKEHVTIVEEHFSLSGPETSLGSALASTHVPSSPLFDADGASIRGMVRPWASH